MALPRFDVVRVVSAIELADAYERTYPYQGPDGITLVIGHYYVVEWSSAMVVNEFDASARYHGPYPSELAARLKLEQRRAMLLVEQAARPATASKRQTIDSPFLN